MLERPADIPKLEDYTPTRFMLPTSHYDEKAADRAVRFIEQLKHTKGKWAGKPFWLFPWQERVVRDIFGILDERGKRQFRTAYVEIPKKNGKSELAAAVALYDFQKWLKMTGVTKLKWMLEAEIIPPSLIEVEKYSFEGFELMGCKKNGQE